MGNGDLSNAAEDFLKAALELERGEGRATTNELARRLGVSAPTATAMAKRLDAQGLVARTPYRGVTLTDRGRLVALEVLRHHRLLERYLVESLGVPLVEVHLVADRLEHVMSEQLEERIDAALGFPTHDPHGDPIPDRELRLADGAGRTLASLDAGQRSVVTRLPDRDRHELRYLAGLDLVPGSLIEVVIQAPFDGPVTVRVGAADHAIARELAAEIGVE
jgi:DtxR family Mn-dependent transcriptional regulator